MSSPRNSPALPAAIDRYQVRELLGTGGFGAVYRAYDPRLEREVALKVLRPELTTSAQVVERFLREAKAAARLVHPHIVPVHDAGRFEGAYYIVSAFIKGRTLASAIPGSGMEPGRAAVLAAQLASALGHAHRQGVLHRDVKPANALVDERGALHLMDFGLAAWTQAAATRLTRVGAVMGTPAYMAPEQAAGDTARLCPATDVYGAGVVLYQMLTGRLPFEGGHPAALAYQIIMVTPPPPSEHRPGLDAGLEAICLKAMEKAPARRYADGEEMAAALAAWVSSTQPLVRSGTTPAAGVPPTHSLPDKESVLRTPRPSDKRANQRTTSDEHLETIPPASAAAAVRATAVRRAPSVSAKGGRPHSTALWLRWGGAALAAAVLVGAGATLYVFTARRPPAPTPAGATAGAAVVDSPPDGPIEIRPAPDPVNPAVPANAAAGDSLILLSGAFVGAEGGRLTAAVDGQQRIFTLSDTAKITIDGKEGKLEGVKKDSALTITARGEVATTVEATSPAPPPPKTTVEAGRVIGVEAGRLSVDVGGKERTFAVPDGARILINYKGGKLTDVKKDGAATVTVQGDEVVRVEALNTPAPPRGVAPFDAAAAKTLQQAWADYLRLPAEREVDLGGGLKMKLALIPPGTFRMGALETDEFTMARHAWARPQHKVELTRPFYMGVYPVTQAEYVRVTGKKNPSAFSKGGAQAFLMRMIPDTSLHPVETVSWGEAAAFCEAAGSLDRERPPGWRYALPTEEQWEYACRAGTTTAYFFGDNAGELAEYAWFRENSRKRTHGVGQRKPNPWGLHDLYGNVNQWCAGRYKEYGAEDVVDPTGDAPTGGRPFRGGGWGSVPGNCRSFSREFAQGLDDARSDAIGFRVCLRPD